MGGAILEHPASTLLNTQYDLHNRLQSRLDVGQNDNPFKINEISF